MRNPPCLDNPGVRRKRVPPANFLAPLRGAANLKIDTRVQDEAACSGSARDAAKGIHAVDIRAGISEVRMI